MPEYIPEEIVDKIIGCAIADSRLFSSRASFVSHTFHQIVLPYKFRSLTIRNSVETDSFLGVQEFCVAINAGVAHALSLAPLVRELTLLRVGNVSHTYYCLNLCERCINGIISFRNLTKLNMEECHFSLDTMKQLGSLVQLQSLHTWRCRETNFPNWDCTSALSNLQSLHTLECLEDWERFSFHLAYIPMKNLRILKTSDLKVIEILLSTSVQLKELWLPGPVKHYRDRPIARTFTKPRPMYDSSLLWRYLSRVSSLTHLSLPNLKLRDGPPPSLIFPFQGLQYLHIHIAFTPRFANQPLKEMKIDTESGQGQAMIEVVVRQHWQGIVFPYVEYLDTDRPYSEIGDIPMKFWREFLLNVNKVGEPPTHQPIR